MPQTLRTFVVLGALFALIAPLAPARDAGPASFGTVLTRVATPTRVAARDGTLAFGAYDTAAQSITLMRRLPDGTIAPVGVPPIRARPALSVEPGRAAAVPNFELTLGRDASNGLTAIYRRCSGPIDETCNLARADLAAGAEHVIPMTQGALRGAIAGRWIAFVRRGTGGADHLYLIGGTRRPARVAEPDLARDLSPGNRVDRSTVRIAAVDLRARSDGPPDVAYVVDFQTAPELAESQLWLSRAGQAPRRIARVGTGGASSGFREFLQPRLYVDSVVVYKQGRDQVNAVFRYTLRGRTLGAGRVGFASTDGGEITGGQWDRGHFWYATNPYQGNGCSGFQPQPAEATCPVIDSGPITLAPPKPPHH